MAPVKENKGIFDQKLLKAALIDSFKKLDPRALWRNPVMLSVEIGSVITTSILFTIWLQEKGSRPGLPELFRHGSG